jgi:hypothetical protein
VCVCVCVCICVLLYISTSSSFVRSYVILTDYYWSILKCGLFFVLGMSSQLSKCPQLFVHWYYCCTTHTTYCSPPHYTTLTHTQTHLRHRGVCVEERNWPHVLGENGRKGDAAPQQEARDQGKGVCVCESVCNQPYTHPLFLSPAHTHTHTHALSHTLPLYVCVSPTHRASSCLVPTSRSALSAAAPSPYSRWMCSEWSRHAWRETLGVSVCVCVFDDQAKRIHMHIHTFIRAYIHIPSLHHPTPHCTTQEPSTSCVWRVLLALLTCPRSTESEQPDTHRPRTRWTNTRTHCRMTGVCLCV